ARGAGRRGPGRRTRGLRRRRLPRARRAGQLAYAAAQYDSTRSVLVTDDALTAARHTLWAEHRFAVEHGAATALAALTDPSPDHGYTPAPDETVCVVLCGANTDPATL
ncbi:hypothetical protein SF12_21210, partial [Streptomyces sp. MBRL 601]